MTFSALLVRRDDPERAPSSAVEPLEPSQLPEGAVEVDVTHSSLNYKDALILAGHPGLVQTYPHVPGIDLAGTVRSSTDPDVAVGDSVLVTGCWLGERHWGGMAERARVPADWVVQRPAGMDAHRAMALGTAGFTAQLAVDAFAAQGVTPGERPVLVTGASGGVGTLAVLLLAAAGHEVEASTGSYRDPAIATLLTELGAARLLPRAAVSDASRRPLASARWAGVVDVAGGSTLAGALAQTRPDGVVVACGLAEDTALATTVMPFIVRGVRLVGIDSVHFPVARRPGVWQRLHAGVTPALLDRLTTTIGLADVAPRAAALLAGGAPGRTVIDVAR